MNKIGDFLNGKKKIAIAGHINPDGDCLGSQLAMTALEYRKPSKLSKLVCFFMNSSLKILFRRSFSSSV